MPRIWNKRDPDVPKDAVYVGRPSPFGNPFSHQENTTAQFKVATREDAIRAYRNWLSQPEQFELRQRIKRELRGRDLVCWCAPLRCHATTLFNYANRDWPEPLPGEPS
jgi:hypothetical protein